MPVKQQHKDYQLMCDKWKRCRDASAGADAIYAGGEHYLPKLQDQSQPEYDGYRKRAPFFNATWRTISGLQGMMFRQPPQVNVPPNVIPMLNDITLSGVPMTIFGLELVEEILTVGRVGIMVDYPQVDTSAMTLADAQSQNLRPMMKSYTAENIINWKTGQVNNATVLTMVVLQELKEVPTDEFTSTEQMYYRVLDLVNIPAEDGTPNIVYRVRMFEVIQQGGQEQDILLSTTYPIINGSNVSFIPFYFMSTDDVDSDVDLPPLLDLVDMNISHYKSTADYEHGCHFTGLPTPVISGYRPEPGTTSFGIGSMTAWTLPEAGAKAYYLEFTGQGLGELKSNITSKEQKMAVLGARMLEAQSAGVESADTAGIHRSGEQSTLASIAQAASIGFTLALKTFCSFAGAPDTSSVTFDLNRDFFPPIIDALTLTALVAGWQNGAYSYASLFAMLKQNEIVALEQTVDGEIAAMAKHPPMIPGGTKVNQDNTGTHQPANPTIRQLQTPS
jgi:hypothetical protein